MEPRTPSDWWQDVVEAERRGELLTAVDRAERGLQEHPGDVALQHRAVLALARAGSTDEATRRFHDYGLDRIDDEEVAALGARLAKDVALAAGGEQRRAAAAESAALYQAIHERTGGYYPAVNAATLWLVAGDREGARALARRTLELLPSADEASYWTLATEAEAQLLLSDWARARDAIARAAALRGEDHAAAATTRRQLRLICELSGADPELLRPLATPPVVHFCGHRIAATETDGRFPADAEPRVAEALEAAVARLRPGYAYGALASGADILWAEALLAADAELHVVLPFAREPFLQSSVADAGPAWIERFDRCLTAAASIRYATHDALSADDVLFRYGSDLAMGLTLLRARYLDAEAHQLAVSDGRPADSAAGTAIDIATWARTGRAATVVTPRGEVSNGAAHPPPVEQEPEAVRGVRALLFADARGFSKLADEQQPLFVNGVLGAIATVLDRYAGVVYRNSWGDGVFAVLTDAPAAADCALDVQAAFGELQLRDAGLPDHLALRVGAHTGPVFRVHDPILGRDSFMGSHISRTARIEPVTPPGAVYVTEEFAAALVLAGRDDLRCDYVGHMPAAKDFGRMRMYRLWRASGAAGS